MYDCYNKSDHEISFLKSHLYTQQTTDFLNWTFVVFFFCLTFLIVVMSKFMLEDSPNWVFTTLTLLKLDNKGNTKKEAL